MSFRAENLKRERARIRIAAVAAVTACTAVHVCVLISTIISIDKKIDNHYNLWLEIRLMAYERRENNNIPYQFFFKLIIISSDTNIITQCIIILLYARIRELWTIIRI